MKSFFPPLLALALVFGLAASGYGADAKAQLDQLVEKVKTKIKAGSRTEAALADELKEFDTLLAEHHGEKTDAVAHILFMKALLYAEVMDNDEKAGELLKKLGEEYPDTADAKNAKTALETFARQAESKKIQRSLAEGAKFPDFEEKDLDGKPLSIANYKGKLVMIDFWATWCGPCVQELPNVLKAYEKYHDKGFEVIGISLDSDKEKLTSFIHEKNMRWPQYFDGQGWQNKLAQRYGVNSIPATYLLDKEGKIIAKGLRGEALDEAIGKALK